MIMLILFDSWQPLCSEIQRSEEPIKTPILVHQIDLQPAAGK